MSGRAGKQLLVVFARKPSEFPRTLCYWDGVWMRTVEAETYYVERRRRWLRRDVFLIVTVGPDCGAPGAGAAWFCEISRHASELEAVQALMEMK